MTMEVESLEFGITSSLTLIYIFRPCFGVNLVATKLKWKKSICHLFIGVHCINVTRDRQKGGCGYVLCNIRL